MTAPTEANATEAVKAQHVVFVGNVTVITSNMSGHNESDRHASRRDQAKGVTQHGIRE
jgi:hypothetical protein